MTQAIKQEVGVSGEYCVVLNAGTEQEQSSGWFKNLILDAGLDRLASSFDLLSSNSVCTYCAVGTSSTAATVSQTDLLAKVATSPSWVDKTNTNSGAPNYQDVLTYSYTFAVGAVVANISEVAVGWSTGTGGKFSRALIVNGVGTPTTITVTATDQLTVYYRLTLTPPITDLTGSVVLAAVTYNYTARLSRAASAFPDVQNFGLGASGNGAGFNLYPAGSTIGAITSSPSGSPTGALSSYSVASYTTGSFSQTTTYTWLPAVGNPAGGIGAISIPFQFDTNSNSRRKEWQYVFATPIPKDNTKTLVLAFTTTWIRL